jgi:hypothetical protein
MKISQDERFWKYVEKGDGCWTWNGSIGSAGYGQIYYNGKVSKAHRVSYEINKGPIPDGLWVLHECDNPACVNPDHLHVGTAQDNSDEKIKRGRANWGLQYWRRWRSSE